MVFQSRNLKQRQSAPVQSLGPFLQIRKPEYRLLIPLYLWSKCFFTQQPYILRVPSGWWGLLQQLPEPSQGRPIGRVRTVKVLTVNLNTILAWCAQHESLRPSSYCYYPVMRSKGQEGVFSQGNLHLFPCVRSTPATQRWNKKACWQQTNPVAMPKDRALCLRQKHAQHTHCYLLCCRVC